MKIEEIILLLIVIIVVIIIKLSYNIKYYDAEINQKKVIKDNMKNINNMNIIKKHITHKKNNSSNNSIWNAMNNNDIENIILNTNDEKSKYIMNKNIPYLDYDNDKLNATLLPQGNLFVYP